MATSTATLWETHWAGPLALLTVFSLPSLPPLTASPSPERAPSSVPLPPHAPCGCGPPTPLCSPFQAVHSCARPASGLPRHLLHPPAGVRHVWVHAFLPHVKPAPVGGEPRLLRLNQESKSHHPLTPHSTAIWLPRCATQACLSRGHEDAHSPSPAPSPGSCVCPGSSTF